MLTYNFKSAVGKQDIPISSKLGVHHGRDEIVSVTFVPSSISHYLNVYGQTNYISEMELASPAAPYSLLPSGFRLILG